MAARCSGCGSTSALRTCCSGDAYSVSPRPPAIWRRCWVNATSCGVAKRGAMRMCGPGSRSWTASTPPQATPRSRGARAHAPHGRATAPPTRWCATQAARAHRRFRSGAECCSRSPIPTGSPRKRAGSGRYLLSNGKGARLEGAQSLRAQRVSRHRATRAETEARIFLAAPLSRAALEETFAEEIVEPRACSWDPRERAVTAVQERLLGALLLERKLARPDADLTARALLDGIRELGLEVLPWERDARILQSTSAIRRRLVAGKLRWLARSRRRGPARESRAMAASPPPPCGHDAHWQAARGFDLRAGCSKVSWITSSAGAPGRARAPARRGAERIAYPDRLPGKRRAVVVGESAGAVWHGCDPAHRRR